MLLHTAKSFFKRPFKKECQLLLKKKEAANEEKDRDKTKPDVGKTYTKILAVVISEW